MQGREEGGGPCLHTPPSSPLLSTAYVHCGPCPFKAYTHIHIVPMPVCVLYAHIVEPCVLHQSSANHDTSISQAHKQFAPEQNDFPVQENSSNPHPHPPPRGRGRSSPERCTHVRTVRSPIIYEGEIRSQEANRQSLSNLRPSLPLWRKPRNYNDLSVIRTSDRPCLSCARS